jgi:hypothetical protein
VIDMTLEDWRALVRKDGWPVAHALQDEFAFQIMRVRQAIRDKTYPRGFEALVGYYRLEVAFTEADKLNLEHPEADADRLREVQARILMNEQMNASIREKIAIWKWKRGELNG